ncbi:Aspartate 1-decarboxylase [hydrothermal vent metagenome]|uniref:Aspartate 1-decarboxylase n=1 Tax=hydrothermal vent metagenome TaxID=652676 RepID=A0A3B1CJY4_9ZZZZ
MFRCMLKAKIHMAKVTDCILQYEGSISIDEDILEAAGMLPYEQVHVSNLDNGERFTTYIIPGERGSRAFMLNGPTARKAIPGDRIIIFSYSWMDEEEISAAVPRVLIMDEENRIKEVCNLKRG